MKNIQRQPLGIISMLMGMVIGVMFLLYPQSSFASTTCSAADVPEQECQALVDLYTSTNGASWTNNGGWNTDNTVCDRYGVECGIIDDGINPVVGLNVIALRLGNNNLVGTLPSSLSAISHMLVFKLNSNSLTGALPSSISAWSDIYLFRVFDNHLQGTLPSSLSAWTNMYYFGANSNNFVGTLPASWSTWTNIHDFNLHDNQLTGTLPSSWGTNWSTVSTIDLNRNYLLGTVPTSWTTMSAITRLDLSFNCLDNNISGPVGSFIDTKYGGPEWRDYQNQCSTSMPTPPHADCSAADVPQQECQALVDLYASTNGASWTHHDGWNTDNTLCDRYGITCTTIGGRKYITTISLPNNNLVGTLPDSLSGISHIKNFEVRQNKLTGTLSSAWSARTEIQYFAISANAIGGLLPSSWSSWNSIKYFMSDYNSLTGTLPSSWSSWTTILEFNLGNNTLQGILPSSWSTWNNIQAFSVYINQLTGTLPSSRSSWRNITSFAVDRNQLRGPLPSARGTSWTHLSRISIYTNYFDGLIPTSRTTMSAIRVGNLMLSDNCLDATLGGTIGSFVDTKAGGTAWRSSQTRCPVVAPTIVPTIIPTIIPTIVPTVGYTNCANADVPQQECQALVDFYTSTNGAKWIRRDGWTANSTLCEWYGVACDFISGKHHITMISVPENNLVGTLPESLSALSYIKILHVEKNKLTGTVSPSWSAWSNINHFAIAYNQLTGTLPSSWSAWKNIIGFVVSNNNFRGTLPSAWGSSWSAIGWIGVANNYFEGLVPTSWLGMTTMKDATFALSYNCLDTTLGGAIGSFIDLKAGSLSWRSTQNQCSKPSMTDSTKPTVVSNLKPATVYAWAYENHITTLPFENARLYNTILRYEAAKMIVQFAENVLKKQIVHNSMCIIGNYKDFGQFDTETKGNITKICDLGLMGRKGTTNTLLDSFRLFSTLSTEELNIIIGRYWKNDAFAVKNNRRIDVMNFLYQAAHQ